MLEQNKNCNEFKIKVSCSSLMTYLINGSNYSKMTDILSWKWGGFHVTFKQLSREHNERFMKKKPHESPHEILNIVWCTPKQYCYFHGYNNTHDGMACKFMEGDAAYTPTMKKARTHDAPALKALKLVGAIKSPRRYASYKK